MGSRLSLRRRMSGHGNGNGDQDQSRATESGSGNNATTADSDSGSGRQVETIVCRLQGSPQQEIDTLHFSPARSTYRSP